MKHEPAVAMHLVGSLPAAPSDSVMIKGVRASTVIARSGLPPFVQWEDLIDRKGRDTCRRRPGGLPGKPFLDLHDPVRELTLRPRVKGGKRPDDPVSTLLDDHVLAGCDEHRGADDRKPKLALQACRDSHGSTALSCGSRIEHEFDLLSTLLHMPNYADHRLDRCASVKRKTKRASMALSNAILVCLTEKPMTGYDLAKAFEASIGFFWRASHQQIYRELAKLKAAGHIDAREVIQSGKPNKVLYSLTKSGRKELVDWSRRTSSRAAIRDELLVKFYAFEHVDRGSLREQLEQRRKHHIDRLQRYERILAKRFANRALSIDEAGRLLGLKLGLRYEQSWAEWCSEALSVLENIDDEPSTSKSVRPLPRR